MAQLANCSRCGKVFAKQIRDICRDCYKLEEQDFHTVYAYLNTRTHREATLNDVVAETNVAKDTIIKFIKEKRLRTSQFPKLAYPCKRCGQHIVSGTMCQACQEELQMDLKQLKQEETKNTVDKKSEPVYFSIHKNK